jgi:predicted ester cyclase
MRGGIPDMTAEIHDMMQDGNKVITRKTFHGTHTGVLFGVPPTGRPVAIDVIDIVRIEDGQLREHWNIVDRLGMLQQLGVIPADG